MEIMGGLLALIVFCLLIAFLVLPWINRARISRIEYDIQSLRFDLNRLRDMLQTRPEITPHVAPQPVASDEPAMDVPRDTGAGVWSDSFDKAGWYASHGSTVKAEPVVLEPAASKPSLDIPPPRKGLEHQLGGRLAVWAGGVALALAGFFLVQYSIRVGLLTPPVRVLLGAAFGLGLLQAGRMVGPSALTDATRIAQALVGAGIASLYASAYTASVVYDLIPGIDGFLAMAAVTAIAVTLSLRHGAPIAVLGMLGGYLTPALIPSPHPSAAALFAYLLLLTVGLIAVLSRRGWWRIAAVTMACALGWVVMWVLFSSLHGGDAVWLDLYLFGVAGCVAWFTQAVPTLASSRDGFAAKWLPGASVAAATILAGWIVSEDGYSLTSLFLYWLLSAAGIGLTARDPRRYAAVPFVSAIWAGLLITVYGVISLGVAHPDDVTRIVEVVLAFFVLHVASGHILMWREKAERPLLWAAVAGFSALTYYLAAWLRLHIATHDVGFPVWGAVAMGLALAAVEATRQIAVHFDKSHPDCPRLLALGAGAATAFISLGLAIELDRDFLPIAVAGEVLALAWIGSRIGWQSLRWYAALLSAVYVCLLLPQFVLLAEIVLYSLTETKVDFGMHVAFAERPLFQLALPAVLFAGASLLLRKGMDDWIVGALEALATALAGLSAYYLTRHLFHAEVLFAPASFLERGINTNVLFLGGLGCLWLGRAQQRKIVRRAGLILAGIGLFRIVYFDLMLCNPLWTPEIVGDLPLVNWLALPYALPIVWLAVLRRDLTAKLAPALKAMALILGFTFVSLEVRQLFHGGILCHVSASSGEVYAYSLAWLLLGIGLLFAGTLRRDRMLRLASLLVMLLTVGKVFLYDAGELDGLWRVFSFLGLGLSLLGLSWFYSRFVFAKAESSSS